MVHVMRENRESGGRWFTGPSKFAKLIRLHFYFLSSRAQSPRIIEELACVVGEWPR